MRSIKGIRVDLGLTQEEMASKLGISKNAYANKENGKAPLTARELIQIHELSGVPLELIQIPR